MQGWMKQGLVLAAIAAMLPCAASARGGGAFMAFGDATTAPRGFVEMCKSDTTFCGPDFHAGVVGAAFQTAALREGGAAMTWSGSAVPFHAATCASPSGIGNGIGDAARHDRGCASGTSQERLRRADVLALLKSVNQRVNAVVTQRSDLEIFGRDEVWQRSGAARGSRGDCEDIAIEKRFELIDAGFAADHLFFAVAYAHGVGLHTVLIARTDSGDWVLDSRNPRIMRWRAAPYVWVTVQSPQDPKEWHIPA